MAKLRVATYTLTVSVSGAVNDSEIEHAIGDVDYAIAHGAGYAKGLLVRKFPLMLFDVDVSS